MTEPGLNRHDWESELRALEDQLAEHPAETLPELDALAARMLAESGFELSDPVARAGEERELVAAYAAAHELVEAGDRHGGLDPGDVAAAADELRAVCERILAERGGADAGLGAAGDL